MEEQNSELLEKIRHQFDTGPYPRYPIEASPQEDNNFLFIHNIVTPFYLRNKSVVNPQGKVILDAGCGSGYKALALAAANPGAKIVGIDLSEESVKLARKRLAHHGIDNSEFHCLSIEELPKLGQTFDYINCDDVLYLIPDLVLGLKSLKLVLKPEGIIRGNLHSLFQRDVYYRAQDVFKMMGLMDSNPGDMEIAIVQEVMRSLKDEIYLKQTTWKSARENDPEFYLANYLLQGDKGYTIPELFASLRAADLEFINMVNWRHWELSELFQSPDDLPTFLAMSLPGLEIEGQLHLFELLQPIHRLLDFWCGHPSAAEPFLPVEEWTESDWQRTRVHLHPQLKTTQVKENLIASIEYQRPFEVSRYLSAPTVMPLKVGSGIASCLLPLWKGPQSVPSLVERWLKIRPMDAVTLEPVNQNQAFQEVVGFLSHLEVCLYVLLEPLA